jgi:hypothetical protein
MVKKIGKYTLHSKNEGTWIKWTVVDKNNIVKFIGTWKEIKKRLK